MLYSRNNGLPFSAWIRHVSSRFHAPINVMLVIVGFTTVLSLINIGSNVALSTMMSLATAALMATDILSIGCMAFRRARKRPHLQVRWSLGRFGTPINFLAIAYASWALFWSFWPQENNVRAANFNWTCVIFPGLMSIAYLLYRYGAKNAFVEPLPRVQYWKSGW